MLAGLFYIITYIALVYDIIIILISSVYDVTTRVKEKVDTLKF